MKIIWASDHWVASSNPLREKFRHSFRLIIHGVCLAQFSLNNVHKRGLKHHHFIFQQTKPEGHLVLPDHQEYPLGACFVSGAERVRARRRDTDVGIVAVS